MSFFLFSVIFYEIWVFVPPPFCAGRGSRIDRKLWKQNLHNVYVKIISPYIYLKDIYRGIYLILFTHVILALRKDFFFYSARENFFQCTGNIPTLHSRKLWTPIKRRGQDMKKSEPNWGWLAFKFYEKTNYFYKIEKKCTLLFASVQKKIYLCIREPPNARHTKTYFYLLSLKRSFAQNLKIWATKSTRWKK